MSRVKIVLFTSMALALIALPSVAADQGNCRELEEFVAPVLPPNQAFIIGTMTGPGWVQSYAVTCSGNARLFVQLRDCCMPGDHFEASARSWDKKPTTVRMLASGSTSGWTSATLRSFGSAPLRALLNVRYLHGINIFPAGFELQLTCLPATSVITWTDEGQVCDTSK